MGTNAELVVREPVDLTDSTWSSAIDWSVGCVLAALAIIVWVFGGWDLGALGALVGMATLYAVARWRAARLSRGLPRLDTASNEGTLLVRVTEVSGSFIRILGSGHRCVLHITDGHVMLSATSTRPTQVWPAAAVQIGPPPCFWTNRGVALDTPDGMKYFTLVPVSDPATYWSSIIDRRALPAIGAALRSQQQRSTSATAAARGWFPDPFGTPSMRWWDGTSWTEHLS